MVDCVSIKHYCEHNKLECEMGGKGGGRWIRLCMRGTSPLGRIESCM